MPMQVLRNSKVLGRDYKEDRETVEIVTQLSIDRISRLESICKVWNGPIVAAILEEDRTGQVTQRSTQHILQELEAKATQRIGFHSLRMIVLTRDKTLPAPSPYPINHLRNIALRNATCEYVFLLDVDCLPSSDLFDSLVGTAELRNSLRNICFQDLGAIVVPCFEPSDPMSFNPLEPFLSQRVRDLASLSSPLLRQFAEMEFQRGHGATNFPKWLQAKEQQTEQCFHQYYQIEYQEGFEPFLIVARALAPLYCEELVGYGRNKILHIYHMFRLGISFWVTTAGCIVHAPHSLTSDRIQLLGNPESSEAPQGGRLDEVKEIYARYRERATVYCASWAALDEAASSADYTFSNFSNLSSPLSELRATRKSRSLFRNNPRGVCGSSIACWPTNQYYSDLIRPFFSASIASKSCYQCTHTPLDPMRSHHSEGFLADLCSVHMIYKHPTFHRLRSDLFAPFAFLCSL
jgi:hypothetical protein